jgi:hypothetical protein
MTVELHTCTIQLKLFLSYFLYFKKITVAYEIICMCIAPNISKCMNQSL